MVGDATPELSAEDLYLQARVERARREERERCVSVAEVAFEHLIRAGHVEVHTSAEVQETLDTYPPDEVPGEKARILASVIRHELRKLGEGA